MLFQPIQEPFHQGLGASEQPRAFTPFAGGQTEGGATQSGHTGQRPQPRRHQVPQSDRDGAIRLCTLDPEPPLALQFEVHGPPEGLIRLQVPGPIHLLKVRLQVGHHARQAMG